MDRRTFLATSTAAAVGTGLVTQTFGRNAPPSAVAQQIKESVATRIVSLKALDRKALLTRFRIWHVEALLNQAADLIDKCVEDFREYMSLDHAWNVFRTELDGAKAQLVLDEKRESEGFLKRDSITAKLRKTYLSDSDSGFATSLAEAEKLYRYDTREAQGQAGWTKAGQNVGEKRVQAKARDGEKALNTAQLTWAELDETYGKESLATRKAVLEKKEALTAPGMPLALYWQRDLVGERLERNFQDALNRAVAATEGLQTIYGYEAGPIRLAEDDSLYEVIIHTAIWIRNSIEWLVAYQQLDQAFTRVASLRSLIGDEKWAALKAATEVFEGSFSLKPDIFGGHENVRVRGLGASIVGKAVDTPWSMTLRLPENAMYRRAGKETPMDQTELPDCILGRIEHRDAPRPIELNGLVSLMNASPLARSGSGAEWLFKIRRPSNTWERFKNIDDIIIEINAVGIPLKSKQLV